MSILVVYLPPRPRLRPRADAPPAPREGAQAADYVYVTSPDGLDLDTHGRATATLLPKASTVIAVVGDAEVRWHRITLPKAPAAKLRAALSGVLEDELLSDAETVHLAVAPGAAAGQPTWVAAIDRQWLRTELARLQRARVFVDRVVPMAWPDDPPIGHFSVEDGGEPGAAAAVS